MSRAVVAAVVAAAILVVAAIATVLWIRSNEVDLDAAAADLTVPDGWVEESRRTTRESPCLPFDPSCDTLRIRWSTGGPVDADTLVEVVTSSGWQVVETEPCPDDPPPSTLTYCSAYGRGDEVTASLGAAHPTEGVWNVELAVTSR